MLSPADLEAHLNLSRAITLCAWNFAGVAHRNDRHGHSHVDREVSELQALIARKLDTAGATVGVGGAEFVSAIYCPYEQSLQLIQEIHRAFWRREPIHGTQVIHGQSHGKAVFLRYPRVGYATRAVRVVYDKSENTPKEERASKLLQLLALCVGFNPIAPVSLEQRHAMHLQRWTDEEWPIPDAVTCPSCETALLAVKSIDKVGYAKANCTACRSEFGLPSWRRAA